MTTDLHTLPDDLAALVAAWPDAITAAGITTPSHCILAAAVLHDVLGDRAETWAVSVLYANAYAQAVLGDLRGMPLARREPLAFTLGVMSGVNGTPAPDGSGLYDGHVVAVVDRRWLLDLSARQFDRPDHGIRVRRPVAIDLDAPAATSTVWVDSGRQWDLRDDLHVGIGTCHYTLLTDVHDWTHAPDWRFVTRRQPVIDQLDAVGACPDTVRAR